MSKFFNTFQFLDGYWKLAPLNSIYPFSITLIPVASLESIFDFSSMISNIYFAAALALATEGAAERVVPVPIAATKSTQTPM